MRRRGFGVLCAARPVVHSVGARGRPAVCSVGASRQMKNANFPLDAEGRTFHLGCRKGEISNRMLSVGDASRAQLLSQFLKPFPNGDPVFNLVSSRGFSITTGVVGDSNTEVSIVTTLMGLANMDFVIRESRAVIDGEGNGDEGHPQARAAPPKTPPAALGRRFEG